MEHSFPNAWSLPEWKSFRRLRSPLSISWTSDTSVRKECWIGAACAPFASPPGGLAFSFITRLSFGFCPGGCGAGLEKAVLLLTGTELFLELATCTGWAVDDLGLLLLIFLSSISSDLLPADWSLILRKEGKRGKKHHRAPLRRFSSSEAGRSLISSSGRIELRGEAAQARQPSKAGKHLDLLHCLQRTDLKLSQVRSQLSQALRPATGTHRDCSGTHSQNTETQHRKEYSRIRQRPCWSSVCCWDGSDSRPLPRYTFVISLLLLTRKNTSSEARGRTHLLPGQHCTPRSVTPDSPQPPKST